MAHMGYCTSHNCLPAIGPVKQKMVDTIFLDGGGFTILCGECQYRALETTEKMRIRVYR